MRTRRHDMMLEALIPRDQQRKVPQDVWNRMEPAQRIEELTSHSLDNCRDILDLPMAMALKSPNVMSGKVQIIRAILTVVTKVGIESTRLRQMQDEVLGQLIDDFDKAERKTEDTGQRTGDRGRSNGHAGFRPRR